MEIGNGVKNYSDGQINSVLVSDRSFCTFSHCQFFSGNTTPEHGQVTLSLPTWLHLFSYTEDTADSRQRWPALNSVMCLWLKIEWECRKREGSSRAMWSDWSNWLQDNALVCASHCAHSASLVLPHTAETLYTIGLSVPLTSCSLEWCSIKTRTDHHFFQMFKNRRRRRILYWTHSGKLTIRSLMMCYSTLIVNNEKFFWLRPTNTH